jgi:hypothetical protein
MKENNYTVRTVVEEFVEKLSVETLEFIKYVEDLAYPEEMKLMQSVQIPYSLSYIYGYSPKDLKVVRGVDWYIIYGENDKMIEISDIASLPTRDVKASRFEMYNFLTTVINKKAHDTNKVITLNAKEDTSYKMIQRMVNSGEYEILEDVPNKWFLNNEIIMHNLVLKPHVHQKNRSNTKEGYQR